MRKETKQELEKANIFDEAKKNKSQAVKALNKAKALEESKLNNGYSYVTLEDGKTKVLRKQNQ